MPAATTRLDLLKRTTDEFVKLSRLLSDIDTDLALRKDAEETSIKDVVAHRAHWIRLFLGWQHDGAAGLPVEMPAPGVKWSELKAYNANLRSREAHLGWDAALAKLDAAHSELLACLESMDDDDLYGGPMPGGNGRWSTGRYAESAGPSHYRSAAKYIRARLRAL